MFGERWTIPNPAIAEREISAIFTFFFFVAKKNLSSFDFYVNLLQSFLGNTERTLSYQRSHSPNMTFHFSNKVQSL